MTITDTAEGTGTSETIEAPSMEADPIVVDESTATDPVADAAKAQGANSEEAPAEGTPDSSTEGEAAPSESGEYTPNFKYKFVNEKGEQVEQEFPKEFQPFIKSKAAEEQFRDVWTKAQGLDFIKPRFLATREENTALKAQITQQFRPLQSELRNLGQAIEGNDLSTAFKKLRISKESVYKWVDEQLRFDGLPPEQRQKIEQDRESQDRARATSEINQNLMSEVQNQAFELRKLQLETSLATPVVSSAAQKFDALYGAGAFRTQVIRHGQIAALSQKRDVPVAEAINSVMQMYKLDQQSAPAPTTETVTQAQPARAQPAANAATGAPKAAPVIPHVSGRGAAPAAKVPTSIQELRELAKQKANS